MRYRILTAAALVIAAIPTANAQEIHVGSHGHHDHHGHHQGHNHAEDLNPNPVSLMGDHMHDKGSWMVSYRFMRMAMDGNRNGTSDLSPEEIVTTIPNRFFGTPMQPSTLRVVPTEMTMDMHMLGAMYAPTDWLTLMAMANYRKNEMDHITFQGGAGTTRLGEFTTKSSGWGDTRLSSLIALYDDDIHHMHLNLGLSVPTGSIKETDDVLTPMNTRPTLRLPYMMQLGTGTYDLHPGLTYTGQSDKFGWGAQYMAEIRLEDENDQGYSWGDKHSLNLWGSYAWHSNFATSLRLSGSTQGKIDGIDSNIIAPVQTADPDNYGGEIVEIGLGATFKPPINGFGNNRLGVEFSAPLYQNLNGPQMKRDYALTLGWQLSF